MRKILRSRRSNRRKRSAIRPLQMRWRRARSESFPWHTWLCFVMWKTRWSTIACSAHTEKYCSTASFILSKSLGNPSCRSEKWKSTSLRLLRFFQHNPRSVRFPPGLTFISTPRISTTEMCDPGSFDSHVRCWDTGKGLLSESLLRLVDHYLPQFACRCSNAMPFCPITLNHWLYNVISKNVTTI